TAASIPATDARCWSSAESKLRSAGAAVARAHLDALWLPPGLGLRAEDESAQELRVDVGVEPARIDARNARGLVPLRKGEENTQLRTRHEFPVRGDREGAGELAQKLRIRAVGFLDHVVARLGEELDVPQEPHADAPADRVPVLLRPGRPQIVTLEHPRDLRTEYLDGLDGEHVD